MATGRNFSSIVHHVQPGSPVSAGNAGRPTRELEQRTNYLREIVENIEAGNLLIARDQPLDTSVAVGNAVAWDPTNNKFIPALAEVDSSGAEASYKSEVIGICTKKLGSDVGTIGLLGMWTASTTEIAGMIDGDPVPGRYFLSGSDAGKLVKDAAPVSVAVAYVFGTIDSCTDDVLVYINPDHKSFLEEHSHAQFYISPFPAGLANSPAPGECHEITAPDSSQPGWLPADDPIFNGLAPAGAVFGYNLSAHPDLQQLWPPVPTDSVVLELLRPVPGDTTWHGMERVSPQMYTVDKNGLWWNTCCYDHVPWPLEYDTDLVDDLWIWYNQLNNHIWWNGAPASFISTAGSSLSASLSSSSSSSSGTPNCFNLLPKMLLSFTKMSYKTNKTVVTSLEPATGQPIEFVNCVGDPARTGELFAKLTLDGLVDKNADLRGSNVIKDVVDGTFELQTGIVTEGIIAGSEKILLSSTEPTTVSDTDPTTLHRGIVTLDVAVDDADLELNPQIFVLGDVPQREYKNIAYLGFPYNRDSNLMIRYNVPVQGMPNNPKLQIRALLFGRNDGPFSALTMEYYRILRPNMALNLPVPITGTTTAVDFDVVTPSTGLPADNIIEVLSDPFDIAAGDTVFVTITRAASATPVYQTDIGLIRVVGVVVT